MNENPENLTKVHIDLPNHWGTNGESLWARPLGDNRYEIRNVPFYAYGLNFLDIVEATADAPDLKPEIRQVIAPSRHRTLRVFFSESVPDEDRVTLLKGLNPKKAFFEGANRRYFAIDVEPDGDYDSVLHDLDRWRVEGVLNYETCELRIQGSFDDVQEEQ